MAEENPNSSELSREINLYVRIVTKIVLGGGFFLSLVYYLFWQGGWREDADFWLNWVLAGIISLAVLINVIFISRLPNVKLRYFGVSSLSVGFLLGIIYGLLGIFYWLDTWALLNFVPMAFLCLTGAGVLGTLFGLVYFAARMAYYIFKK